MTAARLMGSCQPVNGPLMARRVSGCLVMSKTLGSADILTCTFTLERVTRIELALSAWEADVLPLNYTRVN
jgi:hypothetical protein